MCLSILLCLKLQYIYLCSSSGRINISSLFQYNIRTLRPLFYCSLFLFALAKQKTSDAYMFILILFVSDKIYVYAGDPVISSISSFSFLFKISTLKDTQKNETWRNAVQNHHDPLFQLDERNIERVFINASSIIIKESESLVLMG